MDGKKGNKALLILHEKYTRPNGSVVEMKIWKVPITKDKPHGYKYSLVYISAWERVLGYDNGEGKGDHRHYRDKEEPYSFKGLQRLIDDFYKDIEKLERGEEL